MRDKIKLSRILILINIIFIFCFSKAECIVQPTKNFYINDYAGILNQETQDYVLNNSVELCDKTGAQIVVVTVKNLENKTREEYALELFRDWGIGNTEKNNGLLVLLALEERTIRIEVGYGLEGCLNDSKVKRIINDCGIPYFKQDDWDTGIKVLYTALLTQIYDEYNLEVPTEVDKVYSSYTTVDDSMSEFVKIVIFVLIAIVGGFALSAIIIILKNPKIHNYNNYRDDDDDNYPGGFWSSGTGGGGFWNSGSGGGFFGGGGSCGGGGASGDF